MCNDLKYGYTTVPLEENEGLADDKNNLINLKLHVTGKSIDIEKLNRLKQKQSGQDFGFLFLFLSNAQSESIVKLQTADSYLQ